MTTKKKRKQATRVKSKSTTRGHTKKPLTKKVALRKHSVSLDNKKYSVPHHVYLKLVKDLEPHRADEEELLSFDDFFQPEEGNVPEWATYLRGLRYREDLTQAEFAEAIGIPQSNLSAMENGKRSIGKELAKRIADTFSSDYRYFL